jgi:hypothetical protein
MKRKRYYIVPQWYRTHDGQRPLSWAIYRGTEFVAYSWSYTKAYIALQWIKRTCK